MKISPNRVAIMCMVVWLAVMVIAGLLWEDICRCFPPHFVDGVETPGGATLQLMTAEDGHEYLVLTDDYANEKSLKHSKNCKLCQK